VAAETIGDDVEPEIREETVGVLVLAPDAADVTMSGPIDVPSVVWG
jgi:hypothetical protein